MVRKGHTNLLPADDLVLSGGDAILVVAETQADIAAGWRAPRQRRARPSRQGSFGCRLHPGVRRQSQYGGRAALRAAFAEEPAFNVLHVRRYDADLVPSPDLVLEFGDRVGVLTATARKEEVRSLFGDTVKAAAEFSYVSLGVGMVLGVLLGLIPIPIPGLGVVTLGIGGGPLIVALILGKLRRTGPMLWVMPLPANIVLRNFGLALFLAAVGINAGTAFRPDDHDDRRFVAADRRRRALGLRRDRAPRRLLSHENSLRRPCRNCVWRNGESGNPGIFQSHGAH